MSIQCTALLIAKCNWFLMKKHNWSYPSFIVHNSGIWETLDSEKLTWNWKVSSQCWGRHIESLNAPWKMCFRLAKVLINLQIDCAQSVLHMANKHSTNITSLPLFWNKMWLMLTPSSVKTRGWPATGHIRFATMSLLSITDRVTVNLNVQPLHHFSTHSNEIFSVHRWQHHALQTIHQMAAVGNEREMSYCDVIIVYTGTPLWRLYCDVIRLWRLGAIVTVHNDQHWQQTRCKTVLLGCCQNVVLYLSICGLFSQRIKNGVLAQIFKWPKMW